MITKEKIYPPKILLFDIETTPNISYTWGKWDQNVIEFIEEGYLLCFAWKFLGDKRVKALSINDFKGNKRKKIVVKLWELFNEADIIVAHNGNKFDIKWANRLFVFHGLTPPSSYKQVDTLLLARAFKFNSNSLNDLGKYLKLGKKIDTGGFELWKGCMCGDEKSFKKMIKYNKQDVELLEKVYLKLRPFAKNHPKVTYKDERACPLCGSQRVIKKGIAVYNDRVVQKWLCKNCGKWSTGETNKIISKENILR